MSIHSPSKDPPGTAADLQADSRPNHRQGTVARRFEPVDRRGVLTPRWFDYIVVVGCSGVLCFGGFGLLLAVVGHFSGAPVFLLGAAGTVVCTVLGRPTKRPYGTHSRPAVTASALGMCFVAVGAAVWNALYAGHDVAVGTDPGGYTQAGRWLASHHSLIVPAQAPWAGKGTFSVFSPGMYSAPHGTLQFQFAHLMPVLLAEGHKLAGDWLMFRVPALLNALALCAIYATGCRLVRRPWLVLVAVTALAVSLPQLYFSRDTFSEPATQVLLWGGIWMLLRAYETRQMSLGFIAGLLIGGTLMTRIDGVAYLIPLPLLAAVGWLACRAEDRPTLLRLYTAVLIGILPTAILGTVDVQRRSVPYYQALRPEVVHLYLAVGLSALAGLGIVLVATLWPAILAWVKARRRPISVAAGWMIVGVLVLAWALRPAGPTSPMGGGVGEAVTNLQKAEGLPVHPETYAEQTLQWISWYLGPITLGLGIAGLCVLTVLAIRRGSPTAVVVLALAAPLTILYIWNPSITPTQIWAMRRYVPASLPLFVLAAAAALHTAASARWSAGNAWSRRILAVGAVGMLAFPLGTTLPVGKFQVQANFLPAVDHICDTIGPNAAVLFPAKDPNILFMQTLRDWCGVPAASLYGPMSPQQLHATAAALRSEGKTLWLVGALANLHQVNSSVTPTPIATASDPRELERTLDRPPQHYTPVSLIVYGYPVP
jgi:hypothetical protein